MIANNSKSQNFIANLHYIRLLNFWKTGMRSRELFHNVVWDFVAAFFKTALNCMKICTRVFVY